MKQTCDQLEATVEVERKEKEKLTRKLKRARSKYDAIDFELTNLQEDHGEDLTRLVRFR